MMVIRRVQRHYDQLCSRDCEYSASAHHKHGGIGSVVTWSEILKCTVDRLTVRAECLRDIGIDKDLAKIACKGEEHMVHTRWCHSMAGEEYGRIYSWGNDPRRKVSVRK